jgi:hypothetical protein
MRTKSKITVAALALAAVAGAIAFTARGTGAPEPRRVTYHAVWYHQPATLREAFALGRIAVLGTVTEVAQAQPIVVSARGEPSGVDAVPTQTITFSTNAVLKGHVANTFTVFHTGQAAIALNGDPPYAVGQQYVLFLATQRPDGRYVIVSPEGRYAVENGVIRTVSDRPAFTALNGLSLARFEDLLGP